MNKYNHSITEFDNSQISAVFYGKYPYKPIHTCRKTLIVDSDGKSVIFRTFTQRLWRGKNLCKGCLHDHIMRICKQIEWEVENEPFEDWGYITIDQKEFTKVRGRLRKRLFDAKSNSNGTNIKGKMCIPKLLPLKFTALPQPSEKMLVIHNSAEFSASKILPADYGKLFHLVLGAVELMPKASRKRASKGFGGDFKGNKGDGRYVVNPRKPVRLQINDPQTQAEWEQGHVNLLPDNRSLSDFTNFCNKNGKGYRVSYGDELLTWHTLPQKQPPPDPYTNMPVGLNLTEIVRSPKQTIPIVIPPPEPSGFWDGYRPTV